MAPRKREPRGRLRPTSLGRREPPLPVMSRTLGAGGAWVLPGEPPSDRIGCARPRRSPPHRSPGLYSRLDHLLSRRTHRAGPRSRHPEPAADCWPEARPVPPGSTTGIGASGGSVDPGRFGLILRPRAPACPTFSGVRGVLPWKAPCVLRHGILGAGTGLPEDDLGSGLTDHRVVFRGKAAAWPPQPAGPRPPRIEGPGPRRAEEAPSGLVPSSMSVASRRPRPSPILKSCRLWPFKAPSSAGRGGDATRDARVDNGARARGPA
jgi:hypothetical protein